MGKLAQCRFGEHAVLRTGYDAQQRQSGIAEIAARRQRVQRPRLKRLVRLLHAGILFLRQMECTQDGQNVARAERTSFYAADMAF